MFFIEMLNIRHGHGWMILVTNLYENKPVDYRIVYCNQFCCPCAKWDRFAIASAGS
ncbi:hypothetical protein D3C81_823880 [compost metagenome]